MLCANAMVGATKPVLQVAEDEVDDRQKLFGHLGVATFGNGLVIEAARPQSAIGAQVVGERLGLHHAAWYVDNGVRLRTWRVLKKARANVKRGQRAVAAARRVED